MRGLQLLAIFWTAPNSLLGITLGLVGLATGGQCQRRGIVLEFWGGGVAWMLRNMPALEGGAAAMTLGHTVLGQSRWDLDCCRDHELIHVRQYERWGPFFIPAYVCCSAWLWVAGKDHYRGNPFEREAFDGAPDGGFDEDDD